MRIYNNTIDYGIFYTGVSCDMTKGGNYLVHFVVKSELTSVLYENKETAFKYIEEFEKEHDLK